MLDYLNQGDGHFSLVHDVGESSCFLKSDKPLQIFTTNGTTAVSNWATAFGSSVSVVNSSFTSISPVGGSFTLSGNTLSWTAVPEPTSALAGLLIGAGLLRRRRTA